LLSRRAAQPTGAFGNQLFELRNSLRLCRLSGRILIAARLGEQRREVRSTATEGAFLFGYLLLGKQEKVTRLSGRIPTIKNKAGTCRLLQTPGFRIKSGMTPAPSP
jgi:hypothetical protein